MEAAPGEAEAGRLGEAMRLRCSFAPDMALVENMGDGSESEPAPKVIVPDPPVPVHVGEIGTDVALGFMPHDGENRRERLRQASLWRGPKEDPGAKRRYVKQRAKQRRGTLDIETRRLQRKALNK
jgi:hypothetical protein